MYDAKKNGRQNYRFFRPEMALEGVEQGRFAQDTWHALDWYELMSRRSPASSR